jgi:uncharacterized membrane protein
MFIEQRRRSIIKSLSWRVTATVSTVIISWFITGEINAALQIGFIEFFAKLMLFYGHERFWSLIKFGIREKSMEYHI